MLDEILDRWGTACGMSFLVSLLCDIMVTSLCRSSANLHIFNRDDLSLSDVESSMPMFLGINFRLRRILLELELEGTANVRSLFQLCLLLRTDAFSSLSLTLLRIMV